MYYEWNKGILFWKYIKEYSKDYFISFLLNKGKNIDTVLAEARENIYKQKILNSKALEYIVE